MAPTREPSSEEPSDKPGSSAQKPKGYEKVVDELRNVLSGLNKGEPQLSSAPELAPQEEELLRPPQPLEAPSDFESEQLGDAAFRQASEPANSNPPSDADFWNGNVLGWPAAPLDPAPSKPVPQKNEETKRPPLSEPPLREPWSEEPPADLPQIFKPTGKKSPVRDHFDEISSMEKEFSLPPAPPPPFAGKNNSGFIDEESSEPTAEIEAEPQVERQNGDQEDPLLRKLQVPIPGTLHQASDSPKKKKADSTLEEMNMKASDVVQIACLYPDGQEQIANDFVYKLKTAAAKSNGSPEIETVLSTPWFSTQIEIHAWKKAAGLSGAHFMFLLASKKDKDLFKDLTKVVHQDEVRARLVYLEQINLRTLYADLLSDVMRNFNGKG